MKLLERDSASATAGKITQAGIVNAYLIDAQTDLQVAAYLTSGDGLASAYLSKNIEVEIEDASQTLLKEASQTQRGGIPPESATMSPWKKGVAGFA